MLSDDDEQVVLMPRKRVRNTPDENRKPTHCDELDHDEDIYLKPRHSIRARRSTPQSKGKNPSAPMSGKKELDKNNSRTPKQVRTPRAQTRKALPPPPMQPPALGGLGAPPSTLGAQTAPPPPSVPPPPTAPPPPPLPAMGENTRPKGQHLKPLIWNKVPKNRLKGTVWQDVKDAAEAIEIDEDAFHALFMIAPSTSVATKNVADKKPTATALLDSKRANNISIILSRVKLPFDELRKAIVTLDPERLSADVVNALLKCVPTAEEIEMIMSSADDPATLGFAERYVVQVGTIPRLQQRLESLAFKQRFNAQLHSFYTDVLAICSACRALRTCGVLRRLLGVVLHLGNILNQGSYRSGAEGFKIECLTRLCELKANSSSVSLLEYALKVALAPEGLNSENWSALEEVSNKVRTAARLSSKELTMEVENFERSLHAIEEEILVHTTTVQALSQNKASDECDRFVDVMTQFKNGAEHQVQELSRVTKEMADELAQTKAFFAEEAKVNSDESFSRWNTFFSQLRTVQQYAVADEKKVAKSKGATSK